MNIGDKIKKLRNIKNLTQEQLAAKCNLSKNAIWNYENDKRIPSLEALNKMAEVLEVEITELISNNSLHVLYFTSNDSSRRFIDENTFKEAIAELKELRISGGISLKKVADLLDVEPELLKKIEDDNIVHPELISDYIVLMRDLLELKRSLILEIIHSGFFNDVNKIHLSTLLQMRGNELSAFIQVIRDDIKFILDDIESKKSNLDDEEDDIEEKIENDIGEND